MEVHWIFYNDITQYYNLYIYLLYFTLNSLQTENKSFWFMLLADLQPIDALSSIFSRETDNTTAILPPRRP